MRKSAVIVHDITSISSPISSDRQLRKNHHPLTYRPKREILQLRSMHQLLPASSTTIAKWTRTRRLRSSNPNDLMLGVFFVEHERR
jgi:hypothetical protein